MKNFSQYVRENNDQVLAALTCSPGFPIRANYREIKLFVNTNDIPTDIGNKLADLHDEYWLQQAGVSSLRGILWGFSYYTKIGTRGQAG